ncbi:hypothetical protein [Fibrella aquatilis]|uniref:Uncharacterized protein n=1 Tax=Fibrella aquatilis TaxID=2817059 RepID=A0A939K317_9BACT|nr:hypothetical protein [Fibrella aquatilis]MBO0933895.1 hypothetical protein [Fibrella aquatilis]
MSKKQYFTVPGTNHSHKNKLEAYVASQLKQFDCQIIESVDDFKTHVAAVVARANRAHPRCKPTAMIGHHGATTNKVVVVGLSGFSVWSVNIYQVAGTLTGAYDGAIRVPEKGEDAEQLTLL